MQNLKLNQLREAASKGKATLFFTDANGIQHAIGAEDIQVLIEDAIARRAQVDHRNLAYARHMLAQPAMNMVKTQIYAEL